MVTINHHMITKLVLCQDVWCIVLGNISQNFAACTMVDSYCCCKVVYQLGAVSMHKHYKLFNLVFSSNNLWQTSMHIILQTVSPLRKTSVPPKHNIATQSVVTVNLLHHLK